MNSELVSLHLSRNFCEIQETTHIRNLGLQYNLKSFFNSTDVATK